jgi:hypothetical protein
MGPNDDIARRMIAGQVGALRHGVKVYNQLDQDLLDLEDELNKRLNKGRGVVNTVKSGAGSIGQQIEDSISTFAENRVGYLLKQIKDRSGIDLKAPKDIGSLRVMNGSVAKFMEDATESAIARAKAAKADGETEGDYVTNLLRSHAKTVSKSGASAAHNAAVIAIARANKTAISGVIALAVLDARTTELCQGRNGGAWDVSTGDPLESSTVNEPFPGRPPWHFNCRTTLSPIIAGEDPVEAETMDEDNFMASPDAAEAFGPDVVQSWQAGEISPIEIMSNIDENLPESTDTSLLKAEHLDHAFAEQKLSTPEQVSAMNSYAHEGYTAINRALRARGGLKGELDAYGQPILSPGLRAQIDAIDEAIAQNKTSAEVIAFRGLNGETKTAMGDGRVIPIKDMKIGDVMEDSAYSSTSVDQRTALGFSDSRHMLRLTIPEGSHAFRVRSRGQYGDEAEVLLPRGTKFEITAIHEEEFQTTYKNKNLKVFEVKPIFPEAPAEIIDDYEKWGKTEVERLKKEIASKAADIEQWSAASIAKIQGYKTPKAKYALSPASMAAKVESTNEEVLGMHYTIAAIEAAGTDLEKLKKVGTAIAKSEYKTSMGKDVKHPFENPDIAANVQKLELHPTLAGFLKGEPVSNPAPKPPKNKTPNYEYGTPSAPTPTIVVPPVQHTDPLTSSALTLSAQETMVAQSQKDWPGSLTTKAQVKALEDMKLAHAKLAESYVEPVVTPKVVTPPPPVIAPPTPKPIVSSGVTQQSISSTVIGMKKAASASQVKKAEAFLSEHTALVAMNQGFADTPIHKPDSPNADKHSLTKVKAGGSLAVYHHDTVSVATANKVADALASGLDEATRKKFADIGTPIVASGSPMDMTKRFKPEQDLTPEEMKMVSGYFKSAPRAVVINFKAESNANPLSLQQNIIHELGHAADTSVAKLAATGKTMSDKDVFKNAYELDLAMHADAIDHVSKNFLNEHDGHRLRYATSSRKEAFAELYGHVVGSKPPSADLAFAQEQMFPNTLKAMRLLHAQWINTPFAA